MAVVSVTDLVLNFADACRLLAPALDRAHVPWRDGSQWDNWYRIAEPLFKTLVTEPCAFQAVGEAKLGRLRVARYGFASADSNAWIAVEGNPPAKMVDLSSNASPFDHVRCGEPPRLVPLQDARFVFVYTGSHGNLVQLETVDLEAE